jgi:CPA2 family monovalent cation:H+ antiporter-2
MEFHIPFAREAAIFFTIAAVFVPLLARLRINPVLSFLLAGALIGPFGLVKLPALEAFAPFFAFTDLHSVQMLGEIGVVLLLFMIGLELAPKRLWAMRRYIFGLGSAQVFICGLVIGIIALYWGNSLEAAMVLGAAFALSSTAVVMKLMTDRRQFSTPFGQKSFSILLLQDLAVVPIIFLIPLLAPSAPETSIVISLVVAFAKAGAMIAAVLLAGRFIARPMLRSVVTHVEGPEYFMAAIVLVLLAAAFATGQAGLSLALGAFLAGLVFAETEFRNQIELSIEPFKGLFMGLFFMSVGMMIDITHVLSNWGWLAASVLGLYGLKAVIIAAVCRMFKTPLSVAVRTGLTLGQAGEFAFVFIGMAAVFGILQQDIAQFMIMVAALTLVLTPALYDLGEYVESLLFGRKTTEQEKSVISMTREFSDHVVIAGFGRTGQSIAAALEAQKIPYAALDLDAPRLRQLRQEGKPVFYGDATNPGALQKVQAGRARVIVLATDDQIASVRMIESIRAMCPRIIICARARDEKHAQILRDMGVQDIVLEIDAMSITLAGHVLREFEITGTSTA